MQCHGCLSRMARTYSQTTCLLYILKKTAKGREGREVFLRGFAFLAFLAVQKCSEDKLFGYKVK